MPRSLRRPVEIFGLLHLAAGPVVGAWFTGRNETAERTLETRSQVVVADPGRASS